MDFEPTERQVYWRDRVRNYIDQHIRPRTAEFYKQSAEGERWKVIPVVEEEKARAKGQGIWNLFMPPQSGRPHVDDSFEFEGPGLTNLEYAMCAEEMGRAGWASEVFNCSAPDTGNMEVLHRYGTREQKDKWLKPLMDGEIRSAFLMTEPAVASSDATNIECSIKRDGDEYVINGRKWWSSGAGHPHCGMLILMGKTDPSARTYHQQSMIIVPPDAPGLKILRYLPVFGYDHAPHGHFEVKLDNVRVPAENLLGGENFVNKGFICLMEQLPWERMQIAVGAVASAQAAIDWTVAYVKERQVFGQPVAAYQNTRFKLAELQTEVQVARVFVDKCLELVIQDKLDTTTASMAKYWTTDLQCKVMDECLQLHGGYGYMWEYPIARAYADARVQRIYGGTNEIMKEVITRSMGLGAK